MQLDIVRAREMATKILSTKFSVADASGMAETLLFAEFCGRKSHGLVRLLPGKFGPLEENPAGEPKVLTKHPFARTIVANGNPGILVAAKAAELASELCKSHGVALVATRGARSSTGYITYYMHTIAKAGFIGIGTAKARSFCAHHLGREALFGTNPISFSFPTENIPFIFDMSTAAIAIGDILNAQLRKTEIPKGVALGMDGEITTDPSAALKGGVLPFVQSHKGSGLMLVIEILAGLFTGSSFATNEVEKGNGTLFIALAPDLFLSRSEFVERMKSLKDTLEKSKTRSAEPLRFPGQQSLKKREAVLNAGWIEIDEILYTSLAEIEAKASL